MVAIHNMCFFCVNRAGLGTKLARETAVRGLSKLKLTPSLVVKVTLDRLRKTARVQMTNLKKLGICLMLCLLLCGL